MNLHNDMADSKRPDIPKSGVCTMKYEGILFDNKMTIIIIMS